jgi:hypothetical protein
MKIIKYIPVILFILMMSCDNIKNPLQNNIGITCGDESTGIPIKKILVEDFTGQKCSNCPEASQILNEIIDDYCDHIVPVAVHCTSFAAPSEEFPSDYRTETGNELVSDYGIISLPIGLINRSEYNGNILLSRNTWRAAVDYLYQLKPEVNIKIESSYNDETNQIEAVITTEFLNDIDYEINLGLYLTEDSITGPQQSGSEVIPNYVHRHMLKKDINGTYGEKIASSGEFGKVIEKTYRFDADSGWNLEHCELVAFISKSSSNEIIQAESEPIVMNLKK